MTEETCQCWSCDHQCGGTQDAGSCGPLTTTHRGPICDACLEIADVWDDDRTAAAARIRDDRIRLKVDAFNAYGSTIWLTAADARQLAEVLMARAADLEG